MTAFFHTPKRRITEILAVLATAAGKFIFMDNRAWRLPFILFAILAWTGYIIYRSVSVPGILAYWGFRKDNFRKVCRMLLAPGIMAIAAFFIIGGLQGAILLHWHIIPVLVLYPLWGTIQQFLLIALIAGNLQDMEGQRLSKQVIVLVAAVLFALVHYPYGWLMAGTFFLALAYGFVYLQARNLFVLGLFHGWLGGLFYYTVLGRDAFAETFGVLFRIKS